MSLHIQNLAKQYGAKLLFEDLSFRFPDKGCVSLIGANGAGKSTLLKILCGLEEADKGQIHYQGVIGYLPQSPNPEPEATVLLEAEAGAGPLAAKGRRLHALLAELEQSASERLLQEYEKLEAQYRLDGGYALEAQLKKILLGLGLTHAQLEAHPTTLSGGLRMRVELAKLIASEPGFLVLDEPTNHLDLPSLVWFETYIRNYTGCCLIVSHDQRLLNTLPQLTLHLERGHITSYKGGYDQFIAQKEAHAEQIRSASLKAGKKADQLESFVERFRSKATKARQVQSRLKELEDLKDQAKAADEVNRSERTLSFQLPEPPKAPQSILRVDGGALGYPGGPTLMSDINIELLRGERLTLVGQNGLGKSTFIKAICEQIPFRSGYVEKGEGLSIGYLAQSSSDKDFAGDNLLDYMLKHTPLGEAQARALLGAFLFSGDDVEKSPKVLSGGEKNRLSLATILATPCNLLILDEPTNHLDVTSIKALKQALIDFAGTLILVSHDRDFINDVSSRLLVFHASRKAYSCLGNLDDYQELERQGRVPALFEAPSEQSQAKHSSTSTKKSVDTSNGQAPQAKHGAKNKQIEQADIKDKQRKRKSLERSVKKHEHTMATLQAELKEVEQQLAEDASNSALSAHYMEVQEQLERAETAWLEDQDSLETLVAELKALGRT